MRDGSASAKKRETSRELGRAGAELRRSRLRAQPAIRTRTHIHIHTKLMTFRTEPAAAHATKCRICSGSTTRADDRKYGRAESHARSKYLATEEYARP
eukprot:6204761-Pleurochrysis_carterae.AAC.1